MNITPIKTPKIIQGSPPIASIVDTAIHTLTERCIIAITSKIISISEGRVADSQTISKETLVQLESQLYLPPNPDMFNISLTVTNNMLIPTAGIDESNGNGKYILWPKDPFRTAQQIRLHLSERFRLFRIGVLITDSKTTPMRYGTTGTSIGHFGFRALKNYIGKPDIFGRNLTVTKANIADGLAAAAVAVMGEGNEQTPLAVISDIPFVEFSAHSPTQKEQEELKISMKDDLYGPLYAHAPWKQGNGARSTQDAIKPRP